MFLVVSESTSTYKAILLFHRVFSYRRHILLWQFRSNDSCDNLVILITLLHGLELKENFRTLYLSIADIEWDILTTKSSRKHKRKNLLHSLEL